MEQSDYKYIEKMGLFRTNELIYSVSDSEISKKINGSLAMSIPLSEITEILQAKNKVLIVKTNTPGKEIWIPGLIERYDEIFANLSKIRTITKSNKNFGISPFVVIALILFFSFFFVVIFITNKWLVTIHGLLLVVFLSGGLFLDRRNSNFKSLNFVGKFFYVFAISLVFVFIAFVIAGNWMIR